MADDLSDDVEEKLRQENDLEELVTIENYQNIDDSIVSPFVKVQPWKHQRQALFCMLKAEDGEYVTNDKGEMFNSDYGILGLPTGTGKTFTTLMLAAYDVPARKTGMRHLESSLNSIYLKKKERTNISVTIICTEEKILDNVWVKDLNTFFNAYEITKVGTAINPNAIPYYRFPTVGVFEKEVKYDAGYIQFSNYINSLEQTYKYWENALQTNPQLHGSFELAMMSFDESINSLSKFFKFVTKKKHELEEYYDKLFTYKIAMILSTVKIAFVGNNHIKTLFDFLKDYTVSRIIFDEPQKIVLKNQKFFREYIKDERYDEVLRHFRQANASSRSREKPSLYAEESPARFIWFCTATPHLMFEKNLTEHYINYWVARNDYLTVDFIDNNNPEDRHFREMVAKYVVRFPYSYIVPHVNPNLQKMCRQIRLKVKRSMVASILEGAVDSDVLERLENDDLQGALDALNTGSAATDILDAALERIIIDYNKQQQKINSYAAGTTQAQIDEGNKKLQEILTKYNDTKRKIDIFRGTIRDEEVLTCSICMDVCEHQFIPREGESSESISKRYGVVHTGCMNVFHHYCLSESLKVRNTCPMCRSVITQDEIKPFCKSGGTAQTLQQQEQSENTSAVQTQAQKLSAAIRSGTHVENETYTNFETLHKVYTSKIEALKDCLKPTYVKVFGDSQYRFLSRNKVLLFVDFKSQQNDKQTEIIRTLQSLGFNVRLPFRLTKVELARQYPPIGNFVVTVPSSTNINKDIEEFRGSNVPTVWIFRSVKESAGLNFEFVDTIIQYSKFSSYRQILGRGLRLTRRTHFDFITLSSTDEDQVDSVLYNVDEVANSLSQTNIN